MDPKNFTPVTNNFLHSLFSQCNATLNGVSIKQSCELYRYGSYVETLLTYGRGSAASHLTNSSWYLENVDVLPCDPTAAQSATTYIGCIIRWHNIKQSKYSFMTDFTVISVMCRGI